MKTKTLKKNKVNVITLGCSKNLVDSEVLMGQLQANNFDVKLAFGCENPIKKRRISDTEQNTNYLRNIS